MEPGLGVRGGSSINQKKKKNFETPNKHSFNKPSTKKNIQNYCFLRYYNAINYENGTCRLFKSSKSFVIESEWIVAAMSLSMNDIIASDKNSSSILLLCYYMVNNLQSLHTIDKHYAYKHLTTNQ